MGYLAAFALGLILSGPSVDDVRRAARDVLADTDIQTEFPGTQSTPRPEPGPPPELRRPPTDFFNIFEALFWILAVVGLVLLVFWLARRMGGFSRDFEAVDPDVEGATRASDDDIPDPDALAGEGRFTEAIHALLLHSIQRLGRSTTVAGSKTSREILRDVPLEGEARTAVSALVGAVEISLFGGRLADRGDYEAYLDHFRRFQTIHAPEPA